MMNQTLGSRIAELRRKKNMTHRVPVLATSTILID